MLTVVCETPGTLRAHDTPKPERAEGDVLLRVKRVGVCGTDLHIFTGNQPYLNYPRVMGHELSGIVEEAPEGGALQAASWAFASQPLARVLPTWLPQSPMLTWTQFHSWQSPVRLAQS